MYSERGEANLAAGASTLGTIVEAVRLGARDMEAFGLETC